MTAIILQIWNYFSLRTKFGAGLFLIALLAFGYFYFQKSAETNKANEHLDQFIESQAVKDSQRIEQAKNAVREAETATNTARNANYNSLSDEELRERIILGTEKIK